ncbi:hypothetical protein LAZ67_1001188 [Cordylochernes scorpioides]|uniref:C2H2-type domain-containing protein n=1 Tax=Cordylochernes scorpioides TaxID=51811 RepID=A0ABY6JYH9_9ARAC|nr:hypothetical protein LAZ67_1001188 [Cordylochernes scorpioides]
MFNKILNSSFYKHCNVDSYLPSDILRLYLKVICAPGNFCHYCHRTFYDAYNLKRHFNTHHSEIQELFTCDFCQRGFSLKHNLKRHVLNRHASILGLLENLSIYIKTRTIKYLQHLQI